jgi:hypothetical protein
MNIRLGLFRIWIVLSALWILFAVSISYDGVHLEFQKEAALAAAKTRMEAAKPEEIPPCKDGSKNCEPWERNWGDKQPQVGSVVKGAWQPKTAIPVEGNPFEDLIPRPSPWKKVFETLCFAVIPPAIIMALGLAGVWIAAGFRSKKSI